MRLLDKMHVELVGDKELKVKIPTRLHLQLHSLKITEGQPIQETVALALKQYFQKLAAERAA